jgi:hypothetical protein
VVNVRVVVRDLSLPHQIVVFTQKGTHKMGVSCHCMQKQPMVFTAFELRSLITTAEARAIWLKAKHKEDVAPFDHNAIAAAKRSRTYRTT